jgi:drug/metabolite transporter (DMT)-like permease
MRTTRDGTAFGAALILAGMALLGFTDNFVRLIADDAGLWQFHLLRSAMALPLLGLAAFALGLALRPRRPGAVAVRSGVQTLAMLLYFGALPMMPIAQVGAGLFTAPLWILLFAALLFGRRIGPRRLAAVGLGFAGVLLMLRPDPSNLELATVMPVAAGALYGLSNLLTREWCADEPVGALLASFFGGLALASAAVLALLALVAAPEAWVEAAPFLVAPWRAPTADLLLWTFVQAAGALLAVGLVARGYQSGETSALAVFEYAFLVSASFWAWALWGETLAPLDFLGVAMIIGSGLIVALTPGPAEALARP